MEKGRRPFGRMEGAKGGIDRLAVIGISFEGEQGHFHMPDVLTALGNKIFQQLAVYRWWECLRRRGYDFCIHEGHRVPGRLGLSPTCLCALHAVSLALPLLSCPALHS